VSGIHDRDGGDPCWISGRDDRTENPLAVYERTYAAIARAPLAGRGSRRHGTLLRRLGVSAFLLVTIALSGLAVVSAVRPLALLWPSPHDAAVVRRMIPVPRPAYSPEVIGTMPTRPKTAVRVGEEREFAVAVEPGPQVHYGWTIDGRPAGTGPRWSYAPQPSEVGHRRVEVAVSAREGLERRAWNVLVRPARPPELIEAQPAAPTVNVVAGTPVRLRVDPRPATSAERLSVTWQLDGAAAGEGNAVTLHPTRAGASVVRAVVRSDLGASTTREWRLAVAPPEEPRTEIARAPFAEPPQPEPPRATAPEEPRTEIARAPLPAHEPAPPVPVSVARERERPTAGVSAPPPLPPRLASRSVDRGSPEQDVRRWLERYAAAWRAHDVEALRRMGQVTTESEASALRRYFDSVQDLDVELNVVAMRTEGDRTTVRFTRLDRFRDPAGRLVLKESPLLEKQVVRTPDGLRFVRPTG
jgi:hypothetical protein